MNKDIFKIIVGTTSIILIVGGILLYLKNMLVTNAPLLKGEEDQFIIPITIQGETYRFCFYTGASISFIPQATVNKLKLNMTDKQVKAGLGAFKYSAVSQVTEKSLCRIGSFPFMSNFAILPPEYEFPYDGLLGGDIINKYRWLFDFEKNKVSLSKSKWLPFIVKRHQDHCWHIDFAFDFSRLPILNLTLNDSIPAKFLMDTGWFSTTHEDRIITPEIEFMLPDSTDVVYHYMLERSPMYLNASNEERYIYKKVLVLNGLRINDSAPINALAFVDINEYHNPNFGVSGVINRSLWLRHRQVLYDPFAGKISFYKSPDDVTPYSDENTNVILNLIPNNGQQQDCTSSREGDGIKKNDAPFP